MTLTLTFKQRKGEKEMKNMTEAEKNKLIEKALKTKERERRTWIKQLLFTKKAREAGITVSDAEIDKYIASRNK